MGKITDDQIRWVLNLDADGVQSEITKFSSVVDDLTAKNKSMSAEMKAATKQMNEAEKQIEKLTEKGLTHSAAMREAQGTYEAAKAEVSDYQQRIAANTETINANKAAIDKVTATMKVEDMTMSQLRKRAADLQKQMDTTSKAANPVAWQKLHAELGNVHSRMNELKGVNDVVGASYASLLSRLRVLPGVFGTIQTRVASAYSTISKSAKDSHGILNSYITALKNKKAAQEAAIIADEKAAVAEATLKKAVAEGKATDELAVAAERARAAATAAATVATEAGAVAMKIFKIALASTGIGLLLVALGSLVAYFESTNEGSRKLKQIMAGLGVYMQEFLKIAGAVGKVLFDAFTHPGGAITALTGFIKQSILPLKTIITLINDVKNGDFGAALTHIKDATKEGFGNMKDMITGTVTAVKDGANAIGKSAQIISKVNLNTMAAHSAMAVQMTKDRQALTIAERAWSTQRIKDLGEIGVLEKQASRQSALDASAKAAAAAKAKKMREDVFNTDLTYAKKNEDLVNKEQSLNSKKDLQAIADAKNRTAELIANKDNEIQTIENKEGKADALIESKAEQAARKALEEQKKGYGLLAETLETAHQERIVAIKKKYADGEITSEVDYHNQLYTEDAAYYTLREQALEEYLKKVKDKELRASILKEIANIHTERLDEEIKFRAAMEKVILDANPLEKENQEYQERLKEVNLFGESKIDLQKKIDATSNAQEKADLQNKLKVLELLEKQHLDNVFKINKEAEDKKNQEAKDAFEKEIATKRKQWTEEIEEMENQLALKKGIGAFSPEQEFNAEAAIQAKKIALIQNEIATMKAKGVEIKDLEAKQKELLKEEQNFTKIYASEIKRRVTESQEWGTAVGQGLEKMITDHRDKGKTLLKSIIDLGLKMAAEWLQQQVMQTTLQAATSASVVSTKMAEATGVAAASTAEAAAQSYATPASIATGGAAGTAETILLSGLIAAALAAATSVVSSMMSSSGSSSGSSSKTSSYSDSTSSRVVSKGFSDGGFTGDGNRYDVAGYVHKGEYVVAQPEMQTPAAMYHVAALENMRSQRTGKKSLPAGYDDGGYTGSPDVPTKSSDGNNSDPDLKDVLGRLCDHLDKGIQTQFNFHYFNKAQTLYNDSIQTGQQS